MSDAVTRAFQKRISRNAGVTTLNMEGASDKERLIGFLAALTSVIAAALGRPPANVADRATGLIGTLVRKYPDKGIARLHAVRDTFQPVIVVTLTTREADGTDGPEITARYPISWL